jgi:hypothetical protein
MERQRYKSQGESKWLAKEAKDGWIVGGGNAPDPSLMSNKRQMVIVEASHWRRNAKTPRAQKEQLPHPEQPSAAVSMTSKKSCLSSVSLPNPKSAATDENWNVNSRLLAIGKSSTSTNELSTADAPESKAPTNLLGSDSEEGKAQEVQEDLLKEDAIGFAVDEADGAGP